jgi:hypothetical protein
MTGVSTASPFSPAGAWASSFLPDALSCPNSGSRKEIRISIASASKMALCLKRLAVIGNPLQDAVLACSPGRRQANRERQDQAPENAFGKVYLPSPISPSTCQSEVISREQADALIGDVLGIDHGIGPAKRCRNLWSRRGVLRFT